MNLTYNNVAGVYWSILNSDHERWNTDTNQFETHDNADWSDYLITDTQIGSSSSRYVELPSLPDGRYTFEGYDEDEQQVGDLAIVTAMLDVVSGEIYHAVNVVSVDDGVVEAFVQNFPERPRIQ